MTSTIKVAVASLVFIGIIAAIFIVLFQDENYMPHATCWRGNAVLIWGMAIGNAIIFVCYALISAGLFRLIQVVNLGPLSPVAAGFAVFIATCGITHLADVITIWHSAFWWQAAGVWLCAIPSIVTASYLAVYSKSITSLAKEIFKVYG